MRCIFFPGMNNSHLEFLRILQGHVSQQVQIGIPSMSSGNQWTPHCAKSCKFKSPRSRNSEMQLIIEFHTTLRRMVPSAKSLAGPDKTLLQHDCFLHIFSHTSKLQQRYPLSSQGFEASMLHQHTFCCLLCFLASSCRGLSGRKHTRSKFQELSLQTTSSKLRLLAMRSNLDRRALVLLRRMV